MYRWAGKHRQRQVCRGVWARGYVGTAGGGAALTEDRVCCLGVWTSDGAKLRGHTTARALLFSGGWKAQEGWGPLTRALPPEVRLWHKHKRQRGMHLSPVRKPCD